jgi:DNA-binding CsgD family transcriptional regulator
MGKSKADVARVIAIARDATLGGTFAERMQHLYAHLRSVIPHPGATAVVFDEKKLAIPDPKHFYAENFSEENLRGFATHYSKLDRAMPVAVANPNTTVQYSDLYPVFGADEFSDYMLSAGSRWGVGVLVPMPAGLSMALCVHRGARQKDFSKREVAALGAIMPEMGRAAFAAVLADRIGKKDLVPGAGEEALIVLDAKGDITHATASGLLIAAMLKHGAYGLILTARALPPDAWNATYRFPAREGMVKAVFVRAERQVVILLALEPLDRFEKLARRAALTQREREVAKLAIEGRQNSEIAAALALSPETVKQHLRNLFRKTGVRSRTELAALFLRSE